LEVGRFRIKREEQVFLGLTFDAGCASLASRLFDGIADTAAKKGPPPAELETLAWSEDPRQIIENLFPLAGARHLIETLANDGLDETETNNIERFKEMLGGKWFNIGNV